MSDYEFASVLKRLQVDQRTGSLVCVGNESVFGRVYVVGGSPRVARCQDREGMEAMQQLNASQLISAKFYDNVDLIRSKSEDADIANFRVGDQVAASDHVGLEESAATSGINALPDVAGNDSLGQKKLSGPVRKILSEELIDYVGPVAQVVVEGLDDNTTLADALRLLALEIGDKDLAKEFVEKVRPKI